ncbi:conserved hypothetical protein [Echinococcus multilocularis]|uniref:Uncharacterized protein n=1 Tax=Echinococcus multilocularis TaxID=6211 RepID=A0A087VX07_ECHMU|nr:conserved hypothetical protein [Echinococcus multilocularis]
MIAQLQVRDEDVEIGSIPSLLRSHPLELAKLGKELRRIEKMAALQRRKRQNSVTRFAQLVPGLRHRGCSRLKCGLYGLISLKSPQSKHKDYIETVLQTIDTFIQWSRSHERILASFSSSSSGDATELKHFCYARPRVTFQNADQIPQRQRRRPQLEVDDEPAEEEWRVQTNFNMNNSAIGCEQEIKRLRHDFRRLVHDLKGSHIASAINLAILLPSQQSWCRMEDEGLEERIGGDTEDIEHNANALVVVGNENQSQINFEKVKSSQEVHKSSVKPVKNKTQSSELYSCNLTIFAAFIALRWARHLLTLASKRGFSLTNQVYFGEIVVYSHSTSLLAILDLSPDNVITCPKLKSLLLKAKATEPQYAREAALQRATDPLRGTTQGAARSRLQPFVRNRVRYRRSESSAWGGAGSGSLITSTPSLLQTRRTMARSVSGGRSSSRSGDRSGGRSSEMSSTGHLRPRKDSNLLASRPLRKRSISAFHMVNTKVLSTRGRRENAQEKSSNMFSMLQRLRKKNAPGYLSLQPVQRISERIKTTLSRLTISMMRGCKYHQIKKTRLGVTLAYVLRNQIRDFLIEEHECDTTGCQDEEVAALATGTDTTDTAAFRVVTHVAVVEVMQQSIIMASQGLHEHCTDTYYSFTFRYTDAITVATVFLIRQFVQFPNVVTTSNPLVRDVYERWLN